VVLAFVHYFKTKILFLSARALHAVYLSDPIAWTRSAAAFPLRTADDGVVFRRRRGKPAYRRRCLRLGRVFSARHGYAENWNGRECAILIHRRPPVSGGVESIRLGELLFYKNIYIIYIWCYYYYYYYCNYFHYSSTRCLDTESKTGVVCWLDFIIFLFENSRSSQVHDAIFQDSMM